MYGPDGLRVSKTTPETTTRYLCNAANVIIETDGEDFITAENVRGLRLISREIKGEALGYIHNGHGDVTALISPAGEIIYHYEYDPYGNDLSIDNSLPYPRPQDEAPDNPFRYCGEYLDLETNTYYLRARNYDPATSRMLSEDTHWNPGNMIYGDCPVRINERQDPSGLTIFTYAPDINAIRQSTNL